MFFNQKSSNIIYLGNSLENIKIDHFGFHDFKNIRGIKSERMHDAFTIHFVISGKGFYHLNNKVYEITENQFFFTPANEMLKYYPDENDPWSYFWFNIVSRDNDELVNFFNTLNLNFNKPYLKLNALTGQKIINTYNTMYKGINFDIPLTYFFHYIVNVILERNHKKDDSYSLVDSIKFFINENYYNPDLRVKDLALKFNHSHSHLYRVFKQKEGLSLQSYLVNYRLEKAVDLFKSLDISIKEAAFAVGFNDYNHFSKTFKKKYQDSPNTFRKNMFL